MIQIQPALCMSSLFMPIGVNPIFLLGYDKVWQELICLENPSPNSFCRKGNVIDHDLAILYDKVFFYTVKSGFWHEFCSLLF